MFSPPGSKNNRRRTRVGRSSRQSGRLSRGSDDGDAHSSWRSASKRPAKKWVKVTRPPTPTASFAVPMWVLKEDLTCEERKKLFPDEVRKEMNAETLEGESQQTTPMNIDSAVFDLDQAPQSIAAANNDVEITTGEFTGEQGTSSLDGVTDALVVSEHLAGPRAVDSSNAGGESASIPFATVATSGDDRTLDVPNDTQTADSAPTAPVSVPTSDDIMATGEAPTIGPTLPEAVSQTTSVTLPKSTDGSSGLVYLTDTTSEPDAKKAKLI